MKQRPVIDVSSLPTYAFGPRDPLWWGVAGLIAIEATVFALTAVAYFYLRGGEIEWPPPGARMPQVLGWAGVVCLLASLWPMLLANRAALAMKLRPMRFWLLVASVIGLAALALRAMEMGGMTFRWNSHAYGSVVWTIFGLHTPGRRLGARRREACLLEPPLAALGLVDLGPARPRRAGGVGEPLRPRPAAVVGQGRGGAGHPALGGGGVRRRFLTGSLAVWVIHGLALWVWHIPRLYEAALASEAVHAVQHLSFFVTAALFWWALVYGRYGRVGYGVGVFYVFTTALHSSILGALLTLAPRLWYPVYGERAAGWGGGSRDALEDQQLASLLMWVPTGVIFIVLGLALFAAWLGESERRVAHTRSETLARSLAGGSD